MRSRGFFIIGFLLFVAALIFYFSSQTYQEQSVVPLLRALLPGSPGEELLSNIQISYWDSVISIETKGYYHFIEFLIRKFAHLFLFGCLAVATFRVLMLFRPKRIFPVVIWSLIFTGIYAAIDEYHQLLTGGRTPLVEDVMLDLTGAVIALIIYVPLFMWRWRKKQ